MCDDAGQQRGWNTVRPGGGDDFVILASGAVPAKADRLISSAPPLKDGILSRLMMLSELNEGSA